MVGSVEVGGALAETLDGGGSGMCETLRSVLVFTMPSSHASSSEGIVGMGGNDSIGSEGIAAGFREAPWLSAPRSPCWSLSDIPKPFTVFLER